MVAKSVSSIICKLEGEQRCVQYKAYRPGGAVHCAP